MIPGAERIGTLSAPDFTSGWIVIPPVRSVQNSPDFIYFIWLDMVNKHRPGGISDETGT